MLENRTLEEQETRRLGKSYEFGIKTILSPHHATAVFPSSVRGHKKKKKKQTQSYQTSGNLKIQVFLMEHFSCQHLIPFSLCLLRPLHCSCASFCSNADPNCQIGSAETSSLKSTLLQRTFQTVTKYLNCNGKFLRE